jgi:hypothetical protein
MIEPTPIIDLTTSRAAGTSSATHLITAKNLQAKLDDAKAGLRIVNARAELSTHTWDGIEEWVGEDGALGLKDPKIVESDVQAQIVRVLHVQILDHGLLAIQLSILNNSLS